MSQLPTVIETSRTLLRPFDFRDVDDVFAYASDPEWARYLLAVPIPYTKEDAKKFIASRVLTDWATHPVWAIELGGSAIGGVNIRLLFGRRIGEVGYSVARAHWGKGIATEAVRAVIDSAFSTLPELERIRATADFRNIASQRVMEKVGMKREGVLRRNRVLGGETVDEVWYGIVRREWESAGFSG